MTDGQTGRTSGAFLFFNSPFLFTRLCKYRIRLRAQCEHLQTIILLFSHHECALRIELDGPFALAFPLLENGRTRLDASLGERPFPLVFLPTMPPNLDARVDL